VGVRGCGRVGIGKGLNRGMSMGMGLGISREEEGDSVSVSSQGAACARTIFMTTPPSATLCASLSPSSLFGATSYARHPALSSPSSPHFRNYRSIKITLGNLVVYAQRRPRSTRAASSSLSPLGVSGILKLSPPSMLSRLRDLTITPFLPS
jgi:hypothetical protein